MQLLLFLFLSPILASPIDELREIIEPVAQTREHVQWLQLQESHLNEHWELAGQFWGIVLDQQSYLLSKLDDEEDELITDEISAVDDKFIYELIRVGDKRGFQNLISNISKNDILESIDYLLENEIIPKLAIRTRKLRDRLTWIVRQTTTLLEKAEEQAVTILEKMSRDETELMRIIFVKEIEIEKIQKIVIANHRIVSELESPRITLPLIRHAPLPRFATGVASASETIPSISSWRSSIDQILSAHRDDSAPIVGRIQAVIRRLPPLAQREARQYVEQKMVTRLDDKIKQLNDGLVRLRKRLATLKSHQTECVGIYASIVVDQAWFLNIHSSASNNS